MGFRIEMPEKRGSACWGRTRKLEEVVGQSVVEVKGWSEE